MFKCMMCQVFHTTRDIRRWNSLFRKIASRRRRHKIDDERLTFVKVVYIGIIDDKRRN